MATIKEIIGMSFKLHREKKGIAQQELADTLGIDRQYMWKIESGKINMTLDYLEAKPEEFFNLKGFTKFKQSNN
jgi:transcriptional regulator with XRE-family HTH domain